MNNSIGYKTKNAKWIFRNGKLKCLGNVSRMNLWDVPREEEFWQETTGYYIGLVRSTTRKNWQFWKPKTLWASLPFYWYHEEREEAVRAIEEYIKNQNTLNTQVKFDQNYKLNSRL